MGNRMSALEPKSPKLISMRRRTLSTSLRKLCRRDNDQRRDRRQRRHSHSGGNNKENSVKRRSNESTNAKENHEDEEKAVICSVQLEAPTFSVEHRAIVYATWGDIQRHISEIGLTSYLEMFKRSPETLQFFSFLKHLSKEDLEFYTQLTNHAVRVTGVLTMLVNQLTLPVEVADRSFADFLTDLGRRHFSYGSQPVQMELLAHAFVESLVCIFPEKPNSASTETNRSLNTVTTLARVEISEAWLAFFNVIVFWMRTGFGFVKNKGRATLH